MTDPLVRRAARVVLIDERDRVLLLHGRDPAKPNAPSWWFTPGGGLEPGETAEQAARREVLEETGAELGDLGPVVFDRVAEFDLAGTHFRQAEVFFVVRARSFEVDASGWNDFEVETISDHRWWPIAELRTTTEIIYPENLLALIDL